jgi:hypothetical protein
MRVSVEAGAIHKNGMLCSVRFDLMQVLLNMPCNLIQIKVNLNLVVGTMKLFAKGLLR